MATDWRAIAIELGNRLRNHAYCDFHPVEDPDRDCPWCLDRAAYLRYEAAAKAGSIPTRTSLDDALEGAQLVDVEQLVREGRETDLLGAPGLPKVRRGLTPVQQEALVHTHDTTLGGVNLICGKPATINALIRRGLAVRHYGIGPYSHTWISAERTPAGVEVRQALLDAGHVDPGPQY